MSRVDNNQTGVGPGKPATQAGVRLKRPCLSRDFFKISDARAYIMLCLGLAGTALATFSSWLLLRLDMPLLSYPILTVTTFTAGTFGTTLWAIGHECGHGSFLGRRTLAHGIGLVLHTLLLFPYFSWAISHAWHHRYTNHIDRGEANVPFDASSLFGRLLQIVQSYLPQPFMFVLVSTVIIVGTPLYLLFGIANGRERRFSSHFVPLFGELYRSGRQRAAASASVLLVMIWVAVVSSLVRSGILELRDVIVMYVGPLLVVYAWVGFYTFLTHTNEGVAWYTAKNFDWVRAQFQTVVRPYPEFFDWLHLRLGSGHLAHHLFPVLPHYHLVSATQFLASEYPAHFYYDPTPILPAFYHIATRCLMVEPKADGSLGFVGVKNEYVNPIIYKSSTHEISR